MMQEESRPSLNEPAPVTDTGAVDIAELAPIADAQRIDVLDVLRGFALIGILLMNIEWFNRAISTLTMPDLLARDLDHGAGFLVKVFVEGKFYKLFSLLFGMGFAVMLLRAEQARRPFFAWFARRAGVLLLIGLVHSIFLWTGDILHDYAFGAFALLAIAWLRTKPRFAFLHDPQALLRIAVGMMVVPLVMLAGIGIISATVHDPIDLQEQHALSETRRDELTKAWPARERELLEYAAKVAPGSVGDLMKDAEEKDAESDDNAKVGDAKDSKDKDDAPATATGDAGKHAKSTTDEKEPPASEHWFKRKDYITQEIFWEDRAMRSPSYWIATKYRVWQTLEGLAVTPFFTLFLLLPIFLIGWWLVETGRISHPDQHLALFRGMVWIGWPFGLVMAMAAGVLMYHPVWNENRGPEYVANALHWCAQMLLCAAYVGTFVLLLRRRFFQRACAWLVPMGRMALTNYLTHSLVFSILFYGYGAGWFNQVPRFPQMGLVLAMIVFQAVFSALWLARFRYGPMEWLWRSATYLKWQPLRRT